MTQSEKKLLERFVKTGDAQAFSEIVNNHSSLVYGVCLRVLDDKDLAMDISQEIFFQLAKSASSITDSLSSWLHRVATRKAINALRETSSRRRRERQYTVERPLEDPDWPELSAGIDQALMQLESEYRDILIKRFFESNTLDQIAEQNSSSTATVSRKINTGLAMMHQRLRKQGFIVAAGALSVMLAQNAA